MDTLEKQIAFICQAQRLKSVTREAWTSDGRREITAEHSVRLALLVGLLAPSFHVDVEKALMMCLVPVSYTHLDVYKRQVKASLAPGYAKGDKVLIPEHVTVYRFQ